MNLENDNDIELLNRILKANNFTMTVYDDTPTSTPEFDLKYSYLAPNANLRLGESFNVLGKQLLPHHGGKLTQDSTTGFIAQFSSDFARTDFLKAFTRAARALYSFPKQSELMKTATGYVLGACPVTSASPL